MSVAAPVGQYSQNWDLESLLPAPTSPAFPELLDKFKADLQKLADQSETLPVVKGAKDAAAWGAFLKSYETVDSLASDLGSCLGCWAAGDATNKVYRQYEAVLSALDPFRERIRTNLEFGLRDAAEAELSAFIAADPWLKRNEFFIQQLRKNARMRLPKAEELLAADLAVDGLHAWGRLYDRVAGELRIKLMEKGEIVEKSAGQIRFDMAERPVRENNFHAYDKAWKTVADTCADALNHIAGTRLTQYKRLGLQDHLDMPLHKNRMRRETLDAMWQAVSARKPMLLKFLAKKAERLGLEKLSWFDVTAPFPGVSDTAGGDEISFDAGCNLVQQTFSAFSSHLGDFAQHSFKNRWVEAENRSGKRQGAFCTDFPTKGETRVFMTFTNTHDNVSTLAHELGHGYHTWVLKDEPLFLQAYPMNLAETASTFAEAVLADARLKNSQSKGERLSILDHMLSDAVAYLMNIHARFIFENNFHRERLDGELSASRLSELMLAAQKESYLDALAPEGWYPDFWVSKLHFYISGLPFYNFPYTFGYLLSTGLFAVAADGTPNFPDRYRKFLLATGCQETEAALQSTFGFDLSKPEFWNKSLDVVERRVEEFMTLTAS